MPFFYQYVVCDQGRDRGTQFFGGGDIQQRGKVQTFGLAGRPPPPSPIPSFSVTSQSSSNENYEDRAWSTYYYFEKSE